MVSTVCWYGVPSDRDPLCEIRVPVVPVSAEWKLSACFVEGDVAACVSPSDGGGGPSDSFAVSVAKGLKSAAAVAYLTDAGEVSSQSARRLKISVLCVTKC